MSHCYMNIHAQEAVIRCEIALLGTESYQPEKFVFLNLAIKINFKLFFPGGGLMS